MTDIQDRQFERLNGAPPGEGVQRDSVGWLYVLVGLVLIGAAVFVGGTLMAPIF